MGKQDGLKVQSCILKVNIHCDGCEQKVKKLLQKIDGVYSVGIDAEQGKVVVSGQIDPAKLIKKLKSSGKHAELWGGHNRGGMAFNQNYPNNPQFRNLQIDNNGKGGKDNMSHQNQKQGQNQKGGGGQQLAHFQNAKGANLPAKEQKSVKFNMQEEDEFDGSDDDFDEFGDYDDEFADDFDDYDDEEDEEGGYGHGHGHGHGHAMHNKMMPMGNGRGPHGPAAMMMNGPAAMKGNGIGGGVGNYGGAKKGDVIDVPMQFKGKGGNYNEGKNVNGGNAGNKNKGGKQKGGGGGDGNNNKKKKNGKSKSGGGLLGRLFGKKSKKGGSADTNKNKSNRGGNGNSNNKGKEGKKGGGGKLDKFDFDLQDFDVPSHGKNGKAGKGGNGHGNMGQMGLMGQRGPMDHMGSMGSNYPNPMEMMRNIPAVQGLPATNGGYYPGMQMQPNPYNMQQQQYMAMMMNQQQQQQQQQQANMNNMYPPPAMMYGRPHPSMNYMPPPPPPPMPVHPMADPMTHVFSDENTESCNVM